MDELELLKKDWNKQGDTFPKVSSAQLYEMLLKKSSSVVKWIFFISVIEFGFWILLDVVIRSFGGYDSHEESLGIPYFEVYSSVLSYGIIIYFVVRFYLNYKKIKSTDSAKVLMKNIINTRKAVRHYVWTNIIVFTFMVAIGFLGYVINDPEIMSYNGGAKLIAFVVVLVVLVGVFIGFIVVFYRLVYGFLTRRLQTNYAALEKMEL